jgi:hypothetical protein
MVLAVEFERKFAFCHPVGVKIATVLNVIVAIGGHEKIETECLPRQPVEDGVPEFFIELETKTCRGVPPGKRL